MNAPVILIVCVTDDSAGYSGYPSGGGDMVKFDWVLDWEKAEADSNKKHSAINKLCSFM
jgi:hypothetical protein